MKMNEDELILDDVKRFLTQSVFKPQSKKFIDLVATGKLVRPDSLCGLKGYQKLLGAGAQSKAFKFCLTSDCVPTLAVKLTALNSFNRGEIEIDFAARNAIYNALHSHMPYNVVRVYGRYECLGANLPRIMVPFKSGQKPKPIFIDPEVAYDVCLIDICQFTFGRDLLGTLRYPGPLTAQRVYDSKRKAMVLKRNKKQWDAIGSIVFQVVMTLAMLREYLPGFSHNDLHVDNILCNPCTHSLVYKIRDKTYTIKNPQYSAFINDFDFAILPGMPNPKLPYLLEVAETPKNNSSDLFFFYVNLATTENIKFECFNVINPIFFKGDHVYYGYLHWKKKLDKYGEVMTDEFGTVYTLKDDVKGAKASDGKLEPIDIERMKRYGFIHISDFGRILISEKTSKKLMNNLYTELDPRDQLDKLIKFAPY